MDSNLVVTLIIFGILFLFFLIGREFLCWYWKINKQIELLERIHEQLKNKSSL